MQKFIAKYQSQIAGVLSGFDRLVLRGSLRKISYVFGLQGYLWAQNVLLKNFGSHVQQISQQVKEAAVSVPSSSGSTSQPLCKLHKIKNLTCLQNRILRKMLTCSKAQWICVKSGISFCI